MRLNFVVSTWPARSDVKSWWECNKQVHAKQPSTWRLREGDPGTARGHGGKGSTQSQRISLLMLGRACSPSGKFRKIPRPFRIFAYGKRQSHAECPRCLFDMENKWALHIWHSLYGKTTDSLSVFWINFSTLRPLLKTFVGLDTYWHEAWEWSVIKQGLTKV